MKSLGVEYAIYLGDTKLPMLDLRVIAYKTLTHATKFCYINELDKKQQEALTAFRYAGSFDMPVFIELGTYNENTKAELYLMRIAGKPDHKF
jgi:hypothetical protein